jgi:hypothetical protein
MVDTPRERSFCNRLSSNRHSDLGLNCQYLRLRQDNRIATEHERVKIWLIVS